MNKQLDLLIKQRDEKLGSIARLQLMNLDRKIYIQTRELVDIVYDNCVTEVYMQRFFGQGILAMPSQVEELHLKRCENSGISECTCLVTNDKPEVSVL